MFCAFSRQGLFDACHSYGLNCRSTSDGRFAESPCRSLHGDVEFRWDDCHKAMIGSASDALNWMVSFDAARVNAAAGEIGVLLGLSVVGYGLV